MTNNKARKLKDTTKITVYNNTTGKVGFRCESSRKKYKWDKPDSIREVPFGDLKELAYSRGGIPLLRDALLIKDIDVRMELGLPIEKEHILDEKDITLLLNEGSVEDLENVLSNTNSGIKEKTAFIAAQIELADLNKLNIIREYTGVDVLAQIQEKKEEEKEKNKESKK